MLREIEASGRRRERPGIRVREEMSQQTLGVSKDSALRVLGGWNLGEVSASGEGLGDSRFATVERRASRDQGKIEDTVRGEDGGAPASSFLDFTMGGLGRGQDVLGGGLMSAREPADGSTGVRGGREERAGLAALPAPRAGEVLGGFRIVSELGRGAFARVYLAEQVNLGGRRVALKVSRAEGDEPQMLARLQHTHIVPIHSVHDDLESGLRLMCMPYLGGANLAQVLEWSVAQPMEGSAGRSLVEALDLVSQRLQSAGGLIERSPFSAGSQLISKVGGPRWMTDAAHGHGHGHSPVFTASFRGHSLKRVNAFLTRFAGRTRSEGGAVRGRLDERDFDQPARLFLREASTIQAAVWLVARLAEGLEHAHSRGLLHHDLKPSNVLIAGDGTPMLLDFNLASTSQPLNSQEGDKAMLGGTLPYMSPEHLDAYNPQGTTKPEAVDARSDLYSLGLILFEMIAGEHPFPMSDAPRPVLDLMKRMMEQRLHAPSLRAVNPSVPWGLDAIVRKSLEPDPLRRYQRARDLAEDLSRFSEDRPLHYVAEPSLRERFGKWARRNPRLCGGVSIAIFSLMLILSFGSLIGILHSNMRQLSTRLKLQVFHDDLTQCRFLLNIVSGPAEHLQRGIDLAEKTLDQQQINSEGRWNKGSWPKGLTEREQAKVGEETSELILMEARAKVYLAGRKHSEVELAGVLEWAVKWLYRAERLDPQPTGALYADRARYLAALGRADLAAIDRRKALETLPATSRDHALLGMSLLGSEGKLNDAESHLLKAVNLDPKSFWSWFVLGHCHYQQGRFLEAAGDFGSCVALEPNFAWPHMNRGIALARAGRPVEARFAYDLAVEVNPSFAEAWLNLSLVNLELDDLAAAEGALTRAMSLGLRDAREYATLAEIKARRGDRAGAEGIFDQVLRERPEDGSILAARGIFRVKADPQGALRDLRIAIESDPRHARAHYGLALLKRVDDPRGALAEANAALRDDPNLIDALQLRAVLKGRLGDLSALDDAERLALYPTRHHLYNAACALAQLVASAGEERLESRSIEFLKRALEAGFPASHAINDRDLDPIRGRSGFCELMEKWNKKANAINKS